MAKTNILWYLNKKEENFCPIQLLTLVFEIALYVHRSIVLYMCETYYIKHGFLLCSSDNLHGAATSGGGAGVSFGIQYEIEKINVTFGEPLFSGGPLLSKFTVSFHSDTGSIALGDAELARRNVA